MSPPHSAGTKPPIVEPMKIAIGPGEDLGDALGDSTVDHVRSHAACCQVVPIDKARGPTVREADLVASAVRNDFVLDQADICHGS